MFASTSERKMRAVQATLFAGWLLLIASLLWDPVTPHLTNPESLASPFRIKEAGVMVQREPLLNVPYAMGARIWWTMLVPILPLFLMVFGHEAWRRICPLSFASQIARRLGFNRKRAVLQRRTGKVEHTIVVVKRDGWIQRNAWYLQGGLLFLGITSRLVFVNSNRIALAVFLLGIIASAIVVGYLYGGKTWCNYICPVNVVQKIYTEPRGIFESSPHLTRPAIPQSMCRTPSKSGDTSACVGCTSNCGDIDLEKAYWDSIANPQRRHVYYMFWGLIIGFYGYYYLYSGTWDYYFSGIWTHETGALGRAFSPGLFIAGQPIAIPKIVAAPLTLAACCAMSLGLGLLLENVYRRTRAATRRISETEIVHHCLCFSGYLSINTFYLFGGRPNLLLLPPTMTRCVDILIVSLTTWWFLQAVQRTPFKFRREGLASSLLEQLKRLKVDVTKYLDGRTLDELKPDEVYVLTKVLPAFSHEQKLAAYRQIVDDAIATGKTKSTVSLSLLHEMRVQMDISDEEHSQLVEKLRAGPPGKHAPQIANSREKWDCLKNYTEILGAALISHVEAGLTLDEAIEDPEVASTSAILRASFQISEVEHTAVLGNIVSAGGVLMGSIANRLAKLKDLLSAQFCMHSYGMTGIRPRAISSLLTATIDRRVHANHLTMLSLLRAVGDSAEARWSAHSMSLLDGEGVRAVLNQPIANGAELTWEEALDPTLIAIFQGAEDAALLLQPVPETVRVHTFREVISDGIDVQRNLHRLANDCDPLVLALALSAFHDFRPATARDLAQNIRHQNVPVENRMLDEVIANILNEPRGVDSSLSSHQRLSVSIWVPGETPRIVDFAKPYVTIGRAPDNDVCLTIGALDAYHLSIERRVDGFALLRSGTGPVFVDARPVSQDRIDLSNGSVVTFGTGGSNGLRLEFTWDERIGHFDVEIVDAMTRMLWMSRCHELAGLPLEVLAELATASEARQYQRNSMICRGGDPVHQVFIVCSGVALREDPPGAGNDELASNRSVDPGCDELIGRFEPGARHDGIRVVSPTAQVLAISIDERTICLVNEAGGIDPPAYEVAPSNMSHDQAYAA